jgi:hypothetical protein
LSNSAQVGYDFANGMAKSVTPCTLGSNPVRMLVCEVFVIGLGVKAHAKRMPSRARESNAGVWIRSSP